MYRVFTRWNGNARTCPQVDAPPAASRSSIVVGGESGCRLRNPVEMSLSYSPPEINPIINEVENLTEDEIASIAGTHRKGNE
jgi:hypothetical protein